MPASNRYLKNNLSLPPLDLSTLQALQSAIHTSLDAIHRNEALSDDKTIYTGIAGMDLMFLRLYIQSAGLSPPAPPVPLCRFQSSLPIRFKSGRVSPLDSKHGEHAVALLVKNTVTREHKSILHGDLFAPLQAALSTSLSPDVAHEVLYGTAGLLAYLISARRSGASHSVTSAGTLQALAMHIIEEGKEGARNYAAVHGPGLPLMWAWHDKYYLGAIHGVAGILIILLQLPVEIRDQMMGDIVPAAHALLGEVDAEGHLPSSLPRQQRAFGELVQLCHGAPGALLLIAALRSACADTSHALCPELDVIEQRLSDRVWMEGLLSKGISLCHGVAGNAWPWLLLSQVREEPDKRDQYLRQALAFLLHATGLPPVGNMEGYGTSESPYGLFTGLAGAVTAWSEACAILHNRLRAGALGTLEVMGDRPVKVLGMPWLGGLGCCGM